MKRSLFEPRSAPGPASVFDRLPYPLWILTSLALAGGFLVAARPEIPAWDYLYSLQGGLALAATVLVGASVWRWSWLAPVLMTVLVFSHLSQALVRQYELPSVLQPFMLALAITAASRYPAERWKRVGLLPLSTGLALIALLTFASSLWASDPHLSDMRSLEGLKYLMIYGLLAGTATTGVLIVRSAWAMVATAAVLAGLGIFQVATGRYDLIFSGLARVKDAHIFGNVFEPRIAGPLGDPNFFAQILLMALPVALVLAWYQKRLPGRMIGLLCTLTIAGAIMFTYSRGAIIALTGQAFAAVLFYRQRARLLTVGAVVVLAAGLLLPSELTSRLTTIKQLLPGTSEGLNPDSSFEERRLFTLTAWEMFLDNPLEGVGAGNYTAHFDEYAARVGTPLRAYDDPHRPHYPHNLYLEIAAENGMLGLCLFLLVIAMAGFSFARSRVVFLRTGRQQLAGLALALQLSLIGYLVSSLFLHGHFQRYLWLLFGFCGAMTLLADTLAEATTPTGSAADSIDDSEHP